MALAAASTLLFKHDNLEDPAHAGIGKINKLANILSTNMSNFQNRKQVYRFIVVWNTK